MAPFSCFPGGSCGSCGSPPRAGPEEQGKRTAGGWDCELGNGMELKEAQRSMVGDFELILGLKEVEGSWRGEGGNWWKVWENSCKKKWLVWVKGGFLFYFVYSKSYHISQNSLIAFVYLENVQIGVAQHQPAAGSGCTCCRWAREFFRACWMAPSQRCVHQQGQTMGTSARCFFKPMWGMVMF